MNKSNSWQIQTSEHLNLLVHSKCTWSTKSRTNCFVWSSCSFHHLQKKAVSTWILYMRLQSLYKRRFTWMNRFSGSRESSVMTVSMVYCTCWSKVHFDLSKSSQLQTNKGDSNGCRCKTLNWSSHETNYLIVFTYLYIWYYPIKLINFTPALWVSQDHPLR